MLQVLIGIHILVSMIRTCNSRTLPSFDYGDKSREEFLRSAIERSSPENARLLAELFGGLELGINLGSETKAVISVGGAATRCQHQSPCFDSVCGLCYDPLLRIHGKCGGASYYTCRGTLPANCVPFSCTANQEFRTSRKKAAEEHSPQVFIKKTPRSLLSTSPCREDQKAQNFEYRKPKTQKTQNLRKGKSVSKESSLEDSIVAPKWALFVPEPVTSCQNGDICVDMRCGRCYDPYLGTHTNCGKMTYYDCASSLPEECRPIRCTDADIYQLFTEESLEKKEVEPLMVRNFSPMKETSRKCY